MARLRLEQLLSNLSYNSGSNNLIIRLITTLTILKRCYLGREWRWSDEMVGSDPSGGLVEWALTKAWWGSGPGNPVE